MRKHHLACFCIALLVAAGSAGRASAEVDAGKVYIAKCKLCHGASGKPSRPFAERGVKDLSDPEWQEGKSDEQIRGVIVEGVEDTLMRGFGKELNAAQLDALVQFIRGLRRK